MIKNSFYRAFAILLIVFLAVSIVETVTAAKEVSKVIKEKSVVKHEIVDGSIDKKDKKKRFIVKNSSELSAARASGCQLAIESRKFDVLLCSDSVGKKMNLIEDIPVHALDIDSNAAVGANATNVIGFTGKGVRIGVLDTGYDYTHPDLASSYVGGFDWINNDSDPMDDNGHGSHVAGIITSDGINSRSIGIAKDAEIVSGKVLNSYGSGYLGDLVDSIYSMVDEYHVDVISMSIGADAGSSSYCDNSDYLTIQLKEAIDYAHSKNVNVVAAAGNTGTNTVSAPGCISSVLSVGAVDNSFNITSTSARGSLVEIYAPGLSVYSTWLAGAYKLRSGTSMATPFISGTIALLREKNSDLDYSKYEEAMISGATQVISGSETIKVLNVSKAIYNVPKPLVCLTPTLKYSLSNGQFVVSWQSQLGCSYNLQETTDLSSGNWLSIGIFDGNDQILQHKMYPDGPMRFFRISVV